MTLTGERHREAPKATRQSMQRLDCRGLQPGNDGFALNAMPVLHARFMTVTGGPRGSQ